MTIILFSSNLFSETEAYPYRGSVSIPGITNSLDTITPGAVTSPGTLPTPEVIPEPETPPDVIIIPQDENPESDGPRS